MESKIHIKWHDELDSTNDELLRHIHDYDNLSVIAAVNQTAGRGQRGNRWLSAPGDNLTFSLLVKPEGFPVREFMAFTFLATLVIRDFLQEEGVPAIIKWPNDIYVGTKKICGMLIENTLEEDRIAASVIGIGLNLNQTAFPGELVNPTSLKRLTGKTYDPHEVLEQICARFEERLPLLENSRTTLYHAYGKDLFQAGIPCRYRDLASGEEFTGTIKGVTREGRLQLERDGEIRSYAFKEVGYIL